MGINMKEFSWIHWDGNIVHSLGPSFNVHPFRARMLQSRTWLLGIGTNMGDSHSYIKMYIVYSFASTFNAHPIETWMLP
jgi:hypothetical protein